MRRMEPGKSKHDREQKLHPIECSATVLRQLRIALTIHAPSENCSQSKRTHPAFPGTSSTQYPEPTRSSLPGSSFAGRLPPPVYRQCRLSERLLGRIRL